MNDSIAPAAVKETGPATKDTPFPGVVAVLAPALAVALALRPRRRL